MKTIKMTKNEAAALYNGLIETKNLKSKKFALNAAKNMKTIKDALQDIEDLGKPSEEFIKLSVQVQQIIKDDPENGKEKIEKLEEDNIELVEQRKSQMDLVHARLLEEVELELNVFSEEVLPEEITADQVNNLIKIIE
tara:strand:+ start:1298 stop:1711 length:414 start_codon:yes stop_codon:yes gene_type:complete